MCNGVANRLEQMNYVLLQESLARARPYGVTHHLGMKEQEREALMREQDDCTRKGVNEKARSQQNIFPTTQSSRLLLPTSKTRTLVLVVGAAYRTLRGTPSRERGAA